MSAEEFFPYDEYIKACMDYSYIIGRMEEFAKQTADKAFDAGREYAYGIVDTYGGEKSSVCQNKEEYINNLFNNEK